MPLDIRKPFLLKKIDTETIAEALMGIFSRVGFPREILSDNGTQLLSQVMSGVTRLISVKQLLSCPYHPMTNGLCEKCNGTLKKMLIRMSSENNQKIVTVSLNRCCLPIGKYPKTAPDSHPSSCYTEGP